MLKMEDSGETSHTVGIKEMQFGEVGMAHGAKT